MCDRQTSAGKKGGTVAKSHTHTRRIHVLWYALMCIYCVCCYCTPLLLHGQIATIKRSSRKWRLHLHNTQIHTHTHRRTGTRQRTRVKGLFMFVAFNLTKFCGHTHKHTRTKRRLLLIFIQGSCVCLSMCVCLCSLVCAPAVHMKWDLPLRYFSIFSKQEKSLWAAQNVSWHVYSYVARHFSLARQYIYTYIPHKLSR